MVFITGENKKTKEKNEKMEWINIKNKLPEEGSLILKYRSKYPSYYWMGNYGDKQGDKVDDFDYWISLPDVPER